MGWGVRIRGERNGLKEYVQVPDLCSLAIRGQRKVCSRKTADSNRLLSGWGGDNRCTGAQETTVEENRSRQQLGHSGA